MRRWWLGAAVGLGFLALAAVAPRAMALGDFSNWYTIAMATAQNRLDDVQNLLIQHQDPDSADDQGRPALIIAANNGNYAIAALLLKYGAHVDGEDKFGNSALHWAALNGRGNIVSLLIEHQATIDLQNHQGITPLMEAAGNGKVAVVRLLLAAGADPKKADYTGRDAAGWAAGKPAVLELLAKGRG